MNQMIFSVYDTKAETFGNPFFAVNSAVATRMFAAAVQDRETPVGRNPEDFDLYQVGVWNPEVGVVIGGDTPIHVVKALSLTKQVA